MAYFAKTTLLINENLYSKYAPSLQKVVNGETEVSLICLKICVLPLWVFTVVNGFVRQPIIVKML